MESFIQNTFFTYFKENYLRKYLDNSKTNEEKTKQKQRNKL